MGKPGTSRPVRPKVKSGKDLEQSGYEKAERDTQTHTLNQEIVSRYGSYLEMRNYKKRGIEGKLAAARDYLIYCDQQGYDYRFISIKDSENYREHMTLLTIDDGSPRYQPATINVALSHLKNFYSFLISAGLAEMNPFADTWRLKEPMKIPKNILSVKQMGKLLNSLNGRDDLKLKVILEVLYSTGMRISELENMHVRDINLREGYLVIRDNKERQDRKAALTEYAHRVLIFYLREDRGENPFLQGKKRTLNRWVNDRLKKKTDELETSSDHLPQHEAQHRHPPLKLGGRDQGGPGVPGTQEDQEHGDLYQGAYRRP